MGSKARSLLTLVWLVSVRRSRPPSIARTETEAAPTAKRSPRGENATERPSPVCAGTAASSRPERASQRRPTASSLAVARYRPSGLKARSQMPRSVGWRIRTRSDRLGRSQMAATRFPQAARPASIRMKVDRTNISIQVAEDYRVARVFDRIDPDLKVRAGRRNRMAIGAQCQRDLVADLAACRNGDGPDRPAGRGLVGGDSLEYSWCSNAWEINFPPGDGQSIARPAECEVERVSLAFDRRVGRLAVRDGMIGHPPGLRRDGERAAGVECERREFEGLRDRGQFPVVDEVPQGDAALFCRSPRASGRRG